MAFTFINYTTRADQTGTSATVNKPTNTSNNDIMFALCSGLTEYVTAPAGWTKLAENHPRTNVYARLYYKIASSEGASYNFTWVSNQKWKITIATYRDGFIVANPIDQISNTAHIDNDDIARAASMTTLRTGEPLIFFAMQFATGGVGSFTKPTAPTTDWAENYDGGDSTSDWSQTIDSMVWSSIGATGNMDAAIGTYSSIDKHAFAVSLLVAQTLSDTITETVATTDTFTGFRLIVQTFIDTITTLDIFSSVKKIWKNVAKNISTWINTDKS